MPTIYSRATRSARSAVSRAIYTLCGKLHHYTHKLRDNADLAPLSPAVIMCAQRSTKRTAQLALTNCAARTKRIARTKRAAQRTAHTKRAAYFINMHKFIAFILVVLTLVF